MRGLMVRLRNTLKQRDFLFPLIHTSSFFPGRTVPEDVRQWKGQSAVCSRVHLNEKALLVGFITLKHLWSRARTQNVSLLDDETFSLFMYYLVVGVKKPTALNSRTLAFGSRRRLWLALMESESSRSKWQCVSKLRPRTWIHGAWAPSCRLGILEEMWSQRKNKASKTLNNCFCVKEFKC